jgi:hypothetical protein
LIEYDFQAAKVYISPMNEPQMERLRSGFCSCTTSSPKISSLTPGMDSNENEGCRCMDEKLSVLPGTVATDAQMSENGTLAKYSEHLVLGGCQLVARRRRRRRRACFAVRKGAQGGGPTADLAHHHRAREGAAVENGVATCQILAMRC